MPEKHSMTATDLTVWLEKVGRHDVGRVGGKNASLGEMLASLSTHGIRVPPGFATTASAYWQYLDANGIRDVIADAINNHATGKMNLAEAGGAIRQAFIRGDWPASLADEIRRGYRQLCERTGQSDVSVAVRSSATAEDLPAASFAGQQETFLNVRGEQALLKACKHCYASLFTDRAITYRINKGFDHLKVALSIGVQQMVRSDQGGAGVMFSIDTETGFNKVVIINAAWGLGENVVQGTIDPDEYEVFKPLLNKSGLQPIIEKKTGGKLMKLIYQEGQSGTVNVPTSRAERNAYVLGDREILQLARWAVLIETHYGMPMDMEWARDGAEGELFIVQARPETVQSQRSAGTLRSYTLNSKGKQLLTGIAIGDAAVSGRVCLLDNPQQAAQFTDGSILVTANTDPDWLPIMTRAAAVITDHGGRTSHAAIVSRELGLPAIVGTGSATHQLHDQQLVTVSCAEGDEGFVYEGRSELTVNELALDKLPATHTQVMLNLGNPAAAFRWWQLPADGVGLARMEFVISNHIGIHPMALVHFNTLKNHEVQQHIAELTGGYADKSSFFVDRLARGLARIAAALYPKPVIIRTSDFKTNEYANLLGGDEFESAEENPMIGFRGASRYYSPRYREGFELECRALRKLRVELGFNNVIVMIPFCRTLEEADQVLGIMKQCGLERGVDGLQVYVMCEIPSNVILAREFARRFDGFSIGSNDLTQLTLGVDRDSEILAPLFSASDPAVMWMIEHIISEAHAAGSKVGLCGQAPSDHPEFARFLVECGIDSISVSPDSFVAVKQHVAAAEQRVDLKSERAARKSLHA